MKDIAWAQVLIAFFLGVALAAVVKSLVGTLRGHAQNALG